MPETATELLVEPSLLKKIESLQIVSRRLFQTGQSGARRTRVRGSGMEFADHREYSPGDDFRTVDWNVYARLDEFIVKTFETEQNLHVSILVDTSASMGFGRPSKLQFAASLAAAIAYIALVNEDGLSIVSIADSAEAEISTGRQSLSPGQIFEFCSEMAPEGGTRLEETLRSFAFHTRYPGLLFVISDFLAPGRLQDYLQPLVYMGYDICGIQVLAPEELDPRLSGEMDIVDSETGVTVPLTVRGETNQQYQDSLSRFLRETDAALKMCHANSVRVTSDMPLDRVILSELRSTGVIQE